MTTGPHLHDLLDPALLVDMLNGGFVRSQVHPSEPLTILNYTEAAAYSNTWNDVTRRCRGLIYRTDMMEVVARPFAKFMNYGQAGADTIDLGAPVHVTDKADGSLGILYALPSGGWAVATRGSFTSEQALHATALFNERYADFKPTPGVTTLFEVVFPANRIVLDYRSLDDLILLGGVGIADGAVYDPSWFGHWPGPVVDTFPAATLTDALAMRPRPNAEGVVVRCLRTGGMLKIKQEDYVALHRIVTGLNARAVWQHLIDGKPLAALIEPLPDEFHPWVEQVVATLTADVDEQLAAIDKAYAEVVASLPEGWARRDFAAVAVPHPLKWALFLLLDGRDPRPELWKRAKPEAYWTPSGRTYTEDNA